MMFDLIVLSGLYVSYSYVGGLVCYGYVFIDIICCLGFSFSSSLLFIVLLVMFDLLLC